MKENLEGSFHKENLRAFNEIQEEEKEGKVLLDSDELLEKLYVGYKDIYRNLGFVETSVSSAKHPGELDPEIMSRLLELENATREMHRSFPVNLSWSRDFYELRRDAQDLLDSEVEPSGKIFGSKRKDLIAWEEKRVKFERRLRFADLYFHGMVDGLNMATDFNKERQRIRGKLTSLKEE
jgi:hypothetical protein